MDKKEKIINYKVFQLGLELSGKPRGRGEDFEVLTKSYDFWTDHPNQSVNTQELINLIISEIPEENVEKYKKGVADILNKYNKDNNVNNKYSSKIFKFTPEGKKQFDALIKKQDDNPDLDYWDDLNSNERLLADLGMYIEGAYTDPNEYNDLKSWLKSLDGDDPEANQKIKKAVKKGWFEISSVEDSMKEQALREAIRAQIKELRDDETPSSSKVHIDIVPEKEEDGGMYRVFVDNKLVYSTNDMVDASDWKQKYEHTYGLKEEASPEFLDKVEDITSDELLNKLADIVLDLREVQKKLLKFRPKLVDELKTATDSIEDVQNKLTDGEFIGEGAYKYGRADSILPMGTVNLKTGDNQYFNVYEEWKDEDENFGAEFWKDPNVQMPYKIIFGSGHDREEGDRQDFQHDQTRAKFGTWTYIKHVDLEQLKELAKEMKSGKLSAYVYK